MIMPRKNSKSVTVIIQTKNSEWSISETLIGLFMQRFKDFELMIIDHGSTDQTPEIVKQFPCRRFRIVSQDDNSGKILNQFIPKAKGEIIVFLNADGVLISPDALQHLIDAFDDEEVQAAFSRQIPRPEANAWVCDDFDNTFPEKGQPPAWIPFSFPFAAMRKSIWQRRPFATFVPGAEDTEWGIWAHLNRVRIEYVPAATVMHSHNCKIKILQENQSLRDTSLT